VSKDIQDQTFVISVRSFIAIGAASLLLVGEYLVLQNDINEAKSLPKVEITRLEVELKNELLLQEFKNIEKDIERINNEVTKIKEQVGR
tara:strand:- start:2232 stop:2498 length:267 start_codon:yes stop_codon:yes gene_type:complete